MNKLSIFLLKALRKSYTKAFLATPLKPECEQDPDKASPIIYDTLMSDAPCMIARFGSTELTSLNNYLGVKNNKGKYIDYIKGNSKAHPKRVGIIG